MYRVLLIKTPSYKDKNYISSKEKYTNHIYDFHKLCIKLKSKISEKFKIQLIGFDNTIKKEYKTFNKNKIIKDVKSMPMGNIQCKGLSLYANYNPNTTVKGYGYGSEEKALTTIKMLEGKNKTYQKRVITTMYYRAKHHKNKTKGMKDAEKIYKKWLDYNKFNFLNIKLIEKFYPLADRYKVSEICRGLKKPKTTDKGFLEVYKTVNHPDELKKIPVKKSKKNGANWFDTRINRLNAKIGQMNTMNIDYFHKDGTMKGLPTKMHTILIMWGYSPYKDKLKKITI